MSVPKVLITVVVLFIIGIIIITIGCRLIAIFNTIIREQITQNVILKNGSTTYNAWLDPPAEIYRDFYFFNVTNSESLFNEKPRLKEIGPYVYRVIRTKVGVLFGENGTKLYYREHKAFVFERERSVGDEKDKFLTLNIPYVAMTNLLRFKSRYMQAAGSSLLDTKLFVTLTVKDLLWGYEPDFVQKVNGILDQLRLSRWNFTFGIYSGPTANGSDNGLFSMGTGLENEKDLCQIHTWKGSNELTYWTTHSANMINGTDGFFFHPFVDQSEILYIFNAEFCRSIHLTFDATSSVSASDIPAYRFSLPTSVFEVSEENRGFCTPGNSCLGAGVLNISSCSVENAPVVISLPHFFKAAPEYQTSVDGLHPDAARHGTFVDVEPYTGIVVNAAVRVQVNIFLETPNNNESVSVTPVNKRDIIFPIIWLNEHATIPDNKAAEFRSQVLVPIMILQGIMYGLIALGGALALSSLVALVVVIIKHNRQIANNTSEDTMKVTISPESIYTFVNRKTATDV